MKYYPSITKNVRKEAYIYAFDKLDGSNIRVEWNNKRGFYKWGTRNQLLDPNAKPFNAAIPIITEKFENDLAMVCQEQKWKDALFFFEFHGPSSFAGYHNFDEPMTATLIDVNPYKMGIMEPSKYLRMFKHLDIAKPLFEGHVTETFFDKVKQSTLKGMTFEGVVCKGQYETPGCPLMFKIKSQAWLDKLKVYCKGDTKLFEKLA